MGARRDQAQRALVVAVGPVVGADREQPGQLALAPGVGLHADRVVAGDLGQPRLQLGDQLAQSGGVVVGGERVQGGELGPRDRHHLRRRVELHRARAEGDHRAVEREVAVGEPAQVAQHLVLGVVAVEHGLGEQRAGAPGRRSGCPRRWPPRRARRRRTRARARPTTSRVEVSSNVMPTVRSSTRRRSRPLPAGRRQDVLGVDVLDGQRVEPGVVAQPVAARRRGPRRRSTSAGAPARRCGRARPGRATRRRSRRCWRAAPGPYRCSTWPSRGGCAARGSAGPGAAPGVRRCRC